MIKLLLPPHPKREGGTIYFPTSKISKDSTAPLAVEVWGELTGCQGPRLEPGEGGLTD